MSESSLAYDRGTNLPLHAKFAVPEVWIVDLPGAAIEVHRQPREGADASRDRLTDGRLAPALVPAAGIDVASLFG